MLESSIANVDQTEFEEEINQKILDEFTPPWVDEITPVPVTDTGQTGTLSRHGHLIKPLTVVQPSNNTCQDSPASKAKTVTHQKRSEKTYKIFIECNEAGFQPSETSQKVWPHEEIAYRKAN